MSDKIIRVIEAATGQPINVFAASALPNAPPVNRAVQGVEDSIQLNGGALIYNSAPLEVAAGTNSLIDLDAVWTADVSIATESTDVTPSLLVEIVDQDAGVVASRQQTYAVSSTAPVTDDVFDARLIGRILGTGQFHLRITLVQANPSDSADIVLGVLSWIVRPQGTLVALVPAP